MRNWNNSVTVGSASLPAAFRLPMRNWNKNVSQSFVSPEWLSDYLWGIETQLPRQALWEFLSRFQTTYEELKQLNRAFFRHLETRFQTTYEELKLLHFFHELLGSRKLSDYLWGIETSSPRLHCRCRQISLSDYLWGIETLIIGNWRVIFSGFQTTYEELKQNFLWRLFSRCWALSDYLWGIETSRPRTSSRLCTRFQTTYEE